MGVTCTTKYGINERNYIIIYILIFQGHWDKFVPAKYAAAFVALVSMKEIAANPQGNPHVTKYTKLKHQTRLSNNIPAVCDSMFLQEDNVFHMFPPEKEFGDV